MGRYRGRHAARHAAARTRRGPCLPESGGSARPAAVSLAILAAVTTTAVAVEPESTSDNAVTVTLSEQAVTQGVEQSTAAAQDTARLGAERASLNAERGVVRARIEAEAKKKAEALALARKQELERIARENERKALAERRAAALQPDAAQQNPKLAAQLLLPDFGFGSDQWGCLDALWIGEADWRWWAKNPSSGAYGIPQSLPANKMASMGADWETNPVTQIKWGLDYIKKAYGTPCGALEFWQAQNPHWY